MRLGILKTVVILALTPLVTNAQNYLQYFKSYDKNAINVFEDPKENDTIAFDGFKVRIGGSFAQQLQVLDHSNTADAVLDADDNNINELLEIGPGFNLATANLVIDVQLEDGVRLHLNTYLSSKHHQDTWVKGGYIQFDKLGFLNSNLLDRMMENVTIRLGHMELNYGDAHFRRTDNGNAMYNPFVGNYIMDAFTTEIGGEIYYRNRGFIAMAALTGGENRGRVDLPDNRKPSIYGKLGYDSWLSNDFRLRLTGSVYTTSGSISNSLYGGDRAGSRYYEVMVNQVGANNFTGRFNPGLRDNITSFVINPFIKFKGLELFGNFEQATGKAANETDDRTWNQLGADLVYRIGAKENLYLAARYNTVSGPLAGSGTEVQIDRMQFGAGWFVTRNILAKVEYVTQEYKDFPSANILSGGEFNGIMLEAVIGF